MNRRTLLACVTAFVAPMALTACPTTFSTVTVSSILSDVALVASGAKAVLGGLSGFSLPPSVSTALTDIQTAAITLAQSGVTLPTGTAQEIIKSVAADVANIAATVGSVVPLPPQVEIVLTAMQVLLPVIETAVGLVVPASVATDAVGKARATLAALP